MSHGIIRKEECVPQDLLVRSEVNVGGFNHRRSHCRLAKFRGLMSSLRVPVQYDKATGAKVVHFAIGAI